MKLHLHTGEGANTITGHGDGYVAVNGRRIEQALIVLAGELIAPWALSQAGAVCAEDFAPLLERKPELVVFGSGKSFQFPHPSIMAAFSAAGIGFEVMDTPAACRTYNVLMSEGRQVAAALLL